MAANSTYNYDYDKKEWSACGQVTDWTCLSCFLGKSMQVRFASRAASLVTAMSERRSH